MEVFRELLNQVDVTANRPRRIVTPLQFLNYDLAKLGHRVPPSLQHNLAPFTSTLSLRNTQRVRRRSGFVQTRHVGHFSYCRSRPRSDEMPVCPGMRISTK